MSDSDPYCRVNAFQGGHREARVDATAKYQAISEALCAAFPSQQDMDILCSIPYDSTIYLHLMTTRPNIDLAKEGHDIMAMLAETPSPAVRGSVPTTLVYTNYETRPTLYYWRKRCL